MGLSGRVYLPSVNKALAPVPEPNIHQVQIIYSSGWGGIPRGNTQHARKRGNRPRTLPPTEESRACLGQASPAWLDLQSLFFSPLSVSPVTLCSVLWVPVGGAGSGRRSTRLPCVSQQNIKATVATTFQPCCMLQVNLYLHSSSPYSYPLLFLLSFLIFLFLSLFFLFCC